MISYQLIEIDFAILLFIVRINLGEAAFDQLLKLRGNSEGKKIQTIAELWHEFQHGYEQWSSSPLLGNEIYPTIYSIVISKGNVRYVYRDILEHPEKYPLQYSQGLKRAIQILETVIKNVDGTVIGGSTEVEKLLQINQYMASQYDNKIEEIIRQSINSPFSARVLEAVN